MQHIKEYPYPYPNKIHKKGALYNGFFKYPWF
jgi:hypothetical protein